MFKTRLLSIIRPLPNSVFGIYEPLGLSLLTQLRVGLSRLNSHKFSHNFSDTINPMCPINDGLQDTEHFILSCHSFEEQGRDLLACVIPVLQTFEFTNVSNPVLLQILLYGEKKLPLRINKSILESTFL